MFQGFLRRRIFTPQIYAFEFFFSLFSRLRHLVYVNYTDVSYNVLGKIICQKKIPFFECVHPKSYNKSILCCLKKLAVSSCLHPNFSFSACGGLQSTPQRCHLLTHRDQRGSLLWLLEDGGWMNGPTGSSSSSRSWEHQLFILHLASVPHHLL